MNDYLDASPTVECVPASGSVFPVGTTPVVCTAKDDCGNTVTCTFTPPQVGTYHVGLHGYTAYSGVTLVVDYQ